MNHEQIDALGKWATHRIQHILEEKEDLENIISVFGKEILQPKTLTKKEKPTLQEIQGLKSTEQNSTKGPYKLIRRAENTNNPAFQKLQNYIKAHNGYVVVHGLKAWNFDDQERIGYRKQ